MVDILPKSGAPATTAVKPKAPKAADPAVGRSPRRHFAVRLWTIRHARFFEWFYNRFAAALLLFDPILRRIGYDRAEAPVAFVEKNVKGLLFDCRMCGQCILSSTGMSCPMNCPKQLRNGPCGGVRANGNCEVEPDMPCVWVKAWEGSRRMRDGDRILDVQKPVDQKMRGTSSWLRVTAEAAADRRPAASSEQRP